MSTRTPHFKRAAKRRLSMIGAIVCMIGPGLSGGSQLPKPDIKVDVRLVNLNVRVATREGRAIAGLGKGDFQVFDDGTRQKVSHFQPMTAPIHLVLLLDLSGSTNERMGIITRAAAGFVDALGPEDEVAVAVFARSFRLLSEFTRDRSLLKSRIRGLENQGTVTGFYDAVWSALDYLDRVETLRKAMVIMTDGLDSSLMDPEKWPAKHGFQELLSRAAGGDSVIYPVYLNTESDVLFFHSRRIHAAYRKAFDQVGAFALQTGGLLFRARRLEDLEGTYRRVALELRTFYSLAYTPASTVRDGSWHRIEIKVERSGAVIRTRPGYCAR